MDDRPPVPEAVHALPAGPPPPIAPPPIITAPPPPPRGRGKAVWKALAMLFIVLFVLSLLSNALSFSHGLFSHSRVVSDRSRALEEIVLERTNSNNKIAVIEVEGVISSGEVDRTDMNMVDYIKEQLKMAEHDSDVKAVILKVNSPGGEVLASDEINQALAKFQERSHKPAIASMQTLAASGGYYISAPCRWIVADELTLTGSIGVIMHGYNYRQLMNKIGIRPQVFKSGRFKDMLNGEREPDDEKLSPEERKTRDEEDRMVQSLIDQTYDKFKEVVKTGREHAAKENNGKGKTLVDDWQDYADGRIFSGKQALAFGFVDELGDFETAVKRAQILANVPSASLVEYRMPFDFGSVLAHIFGKTEAPAIKVDLGVELPRLEAGRLYFIAPMTVLH
ncbi:MAG: signal peptide peptidase SppA [Verrucomicrobiota bacterium]|jgi:protease-4